MTRNMKEYKNKLLKMYFSSYYKDIAPKDDEHWEWVICLTDQSFGKVFSELSKGALILDAGCGVGYLEFYLLEKGFTNIDAVDISAEQIEIAKRYLKQYQLPTDKMKFCCVDIFEHLKQCFNKYDVITAIDILEHFSKDEAFKFLELSYNALKKEGYIIVRVPNMEHPFHSSYFLHHDFTHEIGFTQSSLKQCLSAAGFSEILINFEKWPPSPTKNLIQKYKQMLSPLYHRFLSILLRLPPKSFSPNIVAIGKKFRRETL